MTVALTSFGLLLLGWNSAHGSVLVNGDFEAGDFTGWNKTGPCHDRQHDSIFSALRFGQRLIQEPPAKSNFRTVQLSEILNSPTRTFKTVVSEVP